MAFGPVKIYNKAMKLIKKISAKEVSKTFWDDKFRKKDVKLNVQLRSPERNDKLYKKKRKVRDDEGKTK
tara:strand:+ start:163 stop:369 length:207 start_codon:yes stop_codon:yes gene_type:complete